MYFKMVHFSIKNAKLRVVSSQVCNLRTSHSSVLKSEMELVSVCSYKCKLFCIVCCLHFWDFQGAMSYIMPNEPNYAHRDVGWISD